MYICLHVPRASACVCTCICVWKPKDKLPLAGQGIAMQGTEESTQKMVIRLQTCNIPFSPQTAVLVNWSVIADMASF